MKKVLYLLVLLPFGVLAEIIPTTPPMILTDCEGNRLKDKDGVNYSASISIHNAMAKLFDVPDGTYCLERPTATFKVKNSMPIVSDEIVFKGFMAVSPTDAKRITYNWKQTQGRDIFLMPGEGQMDFIMGFDLPTGIKFNILAIEEQ